MWSLLRAGVEVLKHGRSGKPKFKTLLCDLRMTKLYWRGPGARPDPDLDESDGDAAEPEHIVTSPHAKQNRRASYANVVRTNADRVILIREIVEVRQDCSTEVLRRSLAKQYISDNTCVISIVLADRTLDFEIQEVGA